jgi:hypothetical protein
MLRLASTSLVQSGLVWSRVMPQASLLSHLLSRLVSSRLVLLIVLAVIIHSWDDVKNFVDLHSSGGGGIHFMLFVPQLPR